MQVCRFTNGGAAIHAINVEGRMHSAWIDAAGTLLDAEMRDRAGRSRPIKPGGPRWQALARIVKRHGDDAPCPSNHWNDGTDTCADCGADLQA